MGFGDAKNGLKKIVIGEILTLAAFLVIICGLPIFEMVRSGQKSADMYVTTDITSAVLYGFTVILNIIAFVLIYPGIKQASKDEDSFMKALIFLFLGIAATIGRGLIKSVSIESVSAIGEKVLIIAGAIFTYYTTKCIVGGIINVANLMGDPDCEDVARGVMNFQKILCATTGIAEVAFIAIFFLKGEISREVYMCGTIGGVITAVVALVAYIIFIRFVKDTIGMIEYDEEQAYENSRYNPEADSDNENED